jgi:hypothetical protein
MKETLRQRSTLIAILAAVAVPLHLWVLLLLAASMPQWLLRLTPVQLIGSVSYSLAFALLETLIVFAVVVALLLILPRRLVGTAPVPAAALAVALTLLLMVWVILTPFAQQGRLLVGFAVYVALLTAGLIALRRNSRLAGAVTAIVDRLIPLALLYIFLDILGVIIVIVRNVFA